MVIYRREQCLIAAAEAGKDSVVDRGVCQVVWRPKACLLYRARPTLPFRLPVMPEWDRGRLRESIR